jgi:hypothetical protein
MGLRAHPLSHDHDTCHRRVWVFSRFSVCARAGDSDRPLTVALLEKRRSPFGVVHPMLVIGVLAASTHICIISPAQRGPLNISTPGDPSCYRRTPYCGGVPLPAHPPTGVSFVAGMPATIRFEQNLNHWYQPNPGFLDIALAHSTDPSEADFVTIATLDDPPLHEMVTTTVFDVEVLMPAKPCAHCILRTRYVSHNPLEIDPKNNTDSIFYNCADIELTAAPHAAGSLPSSLGISPKAARAQPPAGTDGYTCRTPDRFQASLLETNAWGVVEHSLWWDSLSQLTRWDKNGSLDGSGRASTLSLINDYAKPLEYVNFISRGHCHIYGNDKFYPWAYGGNATGAGLVHTGRTSSNIDVWKGTRGGFTWFTRDLGGGYCSPVGWRLGASSVDMVEFAAVSQFAAGTFTPSPSCTKHPTFAGCRAEATKALWASGP